ncbi:MAG TPA: DNA repair protein RecN [Solirubrobacteraceae bacterium]|jgi:DNA repair protein RecN (Recombination protein N)|nr:DNA repair protein RecN [Solirubrobacteraceae bacterium]
MLYELRVENLLLMERAELRLSEGLNVLTGETGAGKTLLAHALDLLLGGRARRGIVRPDAPEAYVEGVFALPPALAGDERLPTGADEIVLARRVWPDGRTRAYVCGRAATQADLQELGARLLSFYGQHEHRKLMLSTAQLELLDTYCGPDQLTLRAGVRDAYERVRELDRRADELRELAGARDRELDLLSFELDEIEGAAPREGESAELAAERDRLRHQDELVRAVGEAAEAIVPEAGTGAAELLAGAARQIEAAAVLDSRLQDLSARLTALQYESQDVGAELRAYALGIDGDAASAAAALEQVEERLALLARLERKHGGTIADVLAHAERCRTRRDELVDADDALERIQHELTGARTELERLAGRLSAARRKAAPRLAAAVRERLAELAMAEARYELSLSERAEGCGPRGADTIEMLIAPNGGETLAPLREVASGGELSRVMLALLSVAHGAPAAAGERGGMLVFDEIDAGIGGHTARAVGQHLRSLAAGRQVLCITHLPQVAALADRHFTIAKDATVTPATTTVTALKGDAVVGELVRMLGASEQDAAAAEHARELLRAA